MSQVPNAGDTSLAEAVERSPGLTHAAVARRDALVPPGAA